MMCYSCFDSAMYQYHGINYKVAEEQAKYLKAYKELGLPVIECEACGAKKKLVQVENNKWKEIFVPAIEESK